MKSVNVNYSKKPIFFALENLADPLEGLKGTQDSISQSAKHQLGCLEHQKWCYQLQNTTFNFINKFGVLNTKIDA